MRRCKLCKCKTAGLIINLNAFCSLDHAIEWANDANRKRAARKKESKRHKREYYENDKQHWERKARMACHAYIRMRDAGLPCVSCGTTESVQYAAGHYRPSGVNSKLRYDERNIHKQCNRYCNKGMSGNLTKYRAGLVARIGEAAVAELDANHETKRWTLEELKEVHRYYTEKLKELKCQST